jgi:hypothetical protein
MASATIILFPRYLLVRKQVYCIPPFNDNTIGYSITIDILIVS